MKDKEADRSVGCARGTIRKTGGAACGDSVGAAADNTVRARTNDRQPAARRRANPLALRGWMMSRYLRLSHVYEESEPKSVSGVWWRSMMPSSHRPRQQLGHAVRK